MFIAHVETACILRRSSQDRVLANFAGMTKGGIIYCYNYCESKRSLYSLNSEGRILASLVNFNFTAGRRLPPRYGLTIIGDKQRGTDHNHLLMNEANKVTEFLVIDDILEKAVDALCQISAFVYVLLADVICIF